MSAPAQQSAGLMPGTILHRLGLLSPKERATTAALRPYRTTRGDRCPICGEWGECFVFPDPAHQHKHVICIRGARFDDSGLPLPRPFGYQPEHVRYYLHDLDTDTPLRPHTQAAAEVPLAPPAIIDHALRLVARLCPLSRADRRKLGKRGYPVEDCGAGKRFLFGTLPATKEERWRLADAVWHCSGLQDHELLGVPGFVRDGRERYAPVYFLPNAPEGTALLEFVQDEQGNLTGLQYAPEHPDTDTKGKPKKRLNPPRLPAGTLYHVAYPDGDLPLDLALCYTEGIHKANLLSHQQRGIGLACLGVGNWRVLLPLAARFDSRKQRQHILAFDQDQWGKATERGLAAEMHQQGYAVVLARWEGQAKGIDDALHAGCRITLAPYPPRRVADDGFRSITYPYPWQQADPAEQQAKLETAGERIAARIRAHIEAGCTSSVLVECSPPGIGKTHAIAALGAELGVAWLAERHDMALQVPAFGTYRHIHAPSPETCPAGYQAHKALAEKGYNAARFHREHPTGLCPYAEQFGQPGATFYPLEYIRTRYPLAHPGLIIDEFSPARWLPERKLTIKRLQAALHHLPTDSPADRLSRQLQALLTTTSQASAGTPWPRDKVLLDALYQASDNRLWGWLGAIHQAGLDAPRPLALIDQTADDVEQQVARLSEVIMPPIWHGLASEMQAWKRGADWNSYLRLTPDSEGAPALGITEPRWTRPQDRAATDPPLPPVAVLDSTADAELYARYFGLPVQLVQEPLDPMPHTRHIAVRTGTRYGKTTLEHNERSLAATIARCRYLLRRYNPDGRLRVGLITFEDLEGELAEALGLVAGEQTLHFWATRGSNQLNGCDLLLIVGTPTPPPQEVERLARAFYHADPLPINPASEKAEDGTRRYADARMQRVADWLIRGELTQCAARNRAIRVDGRIVISLCAEEIDFLPVTERITALPVLATTEDGGARTAGSGQTLKEANRAKAEAALEVAYQELQAAGAPITVATLAKHSHIRKATVCTWLQAKQTEQNCEAYFDDGSRLFSNISSYKQMGTAAKIPAQESAGTSQEPEMVVECLPVPPCSAASHAGFWRVVAGTLRCVLCATV